MSALDGTTIAELLVHRLSQEIADEAVVQVGAYTPMVLAAALLAKATHAPRAKVYAIGPSAVEIARPFPMSLFMVEPLAVGQGVQISNREVIDRMQARGVPFEPLAPAQFDGFGNVNLRLVKTPSGRVIVLPGAAGVDALSIMPQQPLILYTTRHSRRVLVPEVDFVTGAGYRVRGKSRADLGIHGRGGPSTVITNLCVMKYDPSSPGVRLESLHPGVALEEVIENTGFAVTIPRDVPVTQGPTVERLRILREEIDPLGIRELEFLDVAARRQRLRALLQEEVLLRNRLAMRTAGDGDRGPR